MTKTPKAFKTSTAILLALSLGQPLPLVAQETVPEGAICADGASPPCAEGVEMILPEDAAEPAAEEAAEEAEPQEAPKSEEPAAEEAAAAEEDMPAEESAAEQPAAEEPAAEQAAPAEESAAEETPSAEQAAPEATTTEEAAPEEEASAEEARADEPAPADEPASEEAAQEVTPEEASEAAQPAAEEPAAGQPAAEEAAAEEPTAEESAGQAPSSTEEAPADEATTTEAPTSEEPAAEEAAAEAPASGQETAPAAEAPLVIEGAEDRVQDARRVLELLGVAADPAEGEAGAAAAEEAAEAEATVETEITEADTRQSGEEFATTASGAVRAGAGGGLSDFEKAALIGLGILAVGAILSNGDEVVANTGDRVVMRRGGDDYYVLKDDDALLRQPGSTVRTETFNDGSTRTTVTRDDGTRIITIRDASGRVLRRVREDADGRQVLLIDDTETYEPVVIERLPDPAPVEVSLDETDPLALRLALERAARDPGRSFSLRQVRGIERVRKLVPEIAFDPVTFQSGSAAIEPSEAGELLRLGDLMVALIDDNPGEMFLIEGHTDAVGPGAFNLALSDRRAESVALALTEYFGVPPENMVVQGYGESDLKIDTLEDERRNRRVTVRRITPLLDQRLARN